MPIAIFIGVASRRHVTRSVDYGAMLLRLRRGIIEKHRSRVSKVFRAQLQPRHERSTRALIRQRPSRIPICLAQSSVAAPPQELRKSTLLPRMARLIDG